MIYISFINLILLITNNVFNSRESDNLYLSTFDTLRSFRSSALITLSSSYFSTSIMFGNFCPVIFIESSNLNNFIPDFLANIRANLLGDFRVDTYFNLVIALAFSLVVPFISNSSTLRQFLRDNFLTLAVDVFSTLSQNVGPNYFLSLYCLFSSFFPLIINSTTFDHLSTPSCLLFPLLPLLDNFTTLFVLS